MTHPNLGRAQAALLALVLLALGLRLAVTAGIKGHSYTVNDEPRPRTEAEYLKLGDIKLGDSQQYELLGASLRHGRYAWNGEPNTFRTPGYPLLIALSGGSQAVLLSGQALLGALAVLLCGLTGRALFGRRAGLVAAGLLAIDVPNLFYTGVVMSETLFVFLLLLAAWLLYRVPGPRTAPWWRRAGPALAGLVFGFAVLVRPVAAIALIPFLLLVAFRRNWSGLALLAAGVCLLPGLWLARNYRDFGRVGLTSNGGYNLYYGNATALVASERGIDRDSARALLARKFAASHPETNPLVLGDELTRSALDIIGRDPLRYAALHLRGIIPVLAGVKSDDLVRKLTGNNVQGMRASILHNGAGSNAAMDALAGFELLVTLGAFAAALVAVALRRRWSRAVLVGVAACLLIAGSPLPDGRLRVPAMPFLYLAAASLLPERKEGHEGARPQPSGLPVR